MGCIAPNEYKAKQLKGSGRSRIHWDEVHLRWECSACRGHQQANAQTGTPKKRKVSLDSPAAAKATLDGREGGSSTASMKASTRAPHLKGTAVRGPYLKTSKFESKEEAVAHLRELSKQLNRLLRANEGRLSATVAGRFVPADLRTSGRVPAGPSSPAHGVASRRDQAAASRKARLAQAGRTVPPCPAEWRGRQSCPATRGRPPRTPPSRRLLLVRRLSSSTVASSNVRRRIWKLVPAKSTHCNTNILYKKVQKISKMDFWPQKFVRFPRRAAPPSPRGKRKYAKPRTVCSKRVLFLGSFQMDSITSWRAICSLS